MFRFEYVTYLWYVPVAIVVMAIMYWLVRRWNTRKLELLGNPEMLTRLFPPGERKWYLWKLLTLMVAVVGLVLAIANPQYGNKKQTVTSESADIYIAFDISESMLAMDVSPSRLDRAKRYAESLIEELKGNRIGIILFAGASYLQMPLTLDYSSAITSIKTANPNYAGIQGTSIADAINKALESHKENDASYRALIIISDGENHEPDALTAAAKAREEGMTVYTVGVGTESGGLIPIKVNGRELYKKDAQGDPVKSKINVNLLRDVARSGGGAFYMVEQGDKSIEDLEIRLAALAKTERSEQAFDVKESYFQYLLGLSLLLLGINWYLKRR